MEQTVPAYETGTVTRPKVGPHRAKISTDTDSVSDLDVDRLLASTGAPVHASSTEADEVASKLKVQFQAVILTKEREWSAKLQKVKTKQES